MEQIEETHIKNGCGKIIAENAMLANSSFNNVNMSDVTIVNANLSDLKLEGAQLGGAVFQNIGICPPDHPTYDPELEQRPLYFDNCDFHNSKIMDCDLHCVEITGRNIEGLTIDGVLVSELLKRHNK